MVNFATFDDLRNFNNKMTQVERSITKSAASNRSSQKKDTFLSHSSKDAEYLPGVIKLLEDHGACVYCDLDDNRMPENPSPETAEIIKRQIGISDRLVLFVTENSKDSKWVPWELGISDAKLSTVNVALFPVSKTNYDQTWAKQEYLGLYRHIVWGALAGEPKPVWMVYDYRKNEATKLVEWCRKATRQW